MHYHTTCKVTRGRVVCCVGFNGSMGCNSLGYPLYPFFNIYLLFADLKKTNLDNTLGLILVLFNHHFKVKTNKCMEWTERNTIDASKEEYTVVFLSLHFSNICVHVCKCMFGAKMPLSVTTDKEHVYGDCYPFKVCTFEYHFKTFLAGYLPCTGYTCEKCNLYIFPWT